MKKIFLLTAFLAAVTACSPEMVTVRFFLQDGTGFSASVSVETGTVLQPENPVRDGYLFKGWYTQSEGGSRWDFTQPLTRSMNFYAQWEKKIHYVTFYPGYEGADASPVRQAFYENDEGLLIPNPFRRDGYKFLGWSPSADSSDIAYTDRALFRMGTVDAALYAVWGYPGPDEYSIVFHSNIPGDDRTAVQTVTEGTATVLQRNTFVYEGHLFLGWSENSAATAPAYPDGGEWVAGKGDVNLYAVWAELLTVEFDANGGTAVEAVTVTKGSPVPRPADPVLSGKIFYAWMKEGARWDFSQQVDSSMKLTAKWVDYAVSYTALNRIDLNADWTNYNGSESFFDSAAGTGLWVFDAAVTAVPEKAFYGNTDLVSVRLPATVTGLGSYAFYNCTSLTDVQINGSPTAVPAYAFYNCKKLKSVTIPDSVTSFGNGAFSICPSLESIRIPEGVTDLGRETFLGATSLKSVSIPSSVQTLEMSVFFACTGLETVVLEEGVTTIDDTAFGYCTSLTEIGIPASVTVIKGAVFTECSSLATVTVKNSTPPTGVTELTFPASVTAIRVPTAETEDYKAAAGWLHYKEVITGF